MRHRPLLVPPPLALAAAIVSMTAACTPAPPPEPPPVVPVPAETPPPPQTAVAAPTPARAVARGMVQPTKGGYEVGGAIVDGELLQEALADAPGRDPDKADWFLGAVVRIEGEVHEVAASPAKDEDGVAVQMRSGPFTQVTRIDAASIEKPAVRIEGTLARSKGFFALAGHLITQDDLAWSLAPNGGRAGDRVRLHGQPRTVVCEPNAQCLIEGSLPLFDVARAERLP
ncbi:hypothetical protein [Polyangium spumosum]|uniref:Uncharacterized protein n=1 Tax=Polyangium spumosum TaxID=889282 RepID=A0A6N7Q4T8_9BACT|nr:hypothetical protein [Polyangium spumosum]MRG97900.1 hypothetical protein [Polyangium spumosum]